MRTSILPILTGVLGLFLLSLGGCYYDEVLPNDLKIIDDVVGDVSFSADIIPIFNQSCNISGCHNSGGQQPDLSPANAYNSLINGQYVNTADPEQSEIYQWMRGNRSLPMPLSGSNPTYNANVLAWIRQGAKND
jgi:hypothetical protein